MPRPYARQTPAGTMTRSAAGRALGLKQGHVDRAVILGKLKTVMLPGVPVLIDEASVKAYARELGRKLETAGAGK